MAYRDVLEQDLPRLDDIVRPKQPPAVNSSTFRHSFVTYLLEDCHDIRTFHELLRHRNIAIQQTYIHVLNRGPSGVESPADRLIGL